MTVTAYEPLGAPNPALDRYRRAVALAYDGEEVAGYLATHVVTFWYGRRGIVRRRWVDPREELEWRLDFSEDYRHGHPDGTENGLSIADEHVLAELAEDRFVWSGRELRLHWLRNESADKAWAVYGWSDQAG